MAVIYGTAGDDYLVGTPFSDQIYGGAGNDTLVGGAGNDTLDGGTGINTASYIDAAKAVIVSLALEGVKQQTLGDGSDTLINIQNLIGSNYDDTLSAGSAAAGLYGGGGDDLIYSGPGDDTLDGGTGVNTVSYANATSGVNVSLALQGAVQNTGAGHDLLTSFSNLVGSPFNDILTGDAHANTIYGGSGNDVVSGGAGNDALYGGDGDDTLDGGPGDDTLNGGYGDNTATYADAPGPVDVTLALVGKAQNTGSAGVDTLYGIQNLIGSNYNDQLFGNHGNNLLMGGPGDDTLYSSAGDDTLNGGPGVDTVSYATAHGPITVSLAVSGPQNVGGGAGNETLISIEDLIGSPFGDHLTGGGTAGNVIYGGGGNDTITGSSGPDVLYGGPGGDVIYGGPGDDTIIGGSGTDAMFGGSGHNVFVFTAVSDSPDTSPDGILDFQPGIDKIDLSQIDANANEPGLQHFVIVPQLTGEAGQLVIAQHSSVWYVQGDTTGAGSPDFTIEGLGPAPLAGDIIL